MTRHKIFVNRIKQGWFPLFVFICLTGCVTPFDPEIKKYEDLLVVDGEVSNIPGSVYVKLSKTSPYNETNKNPVNAARVTLIDDLDNRMEFINPANGKYVPTDPEFAGEIGRSYRIHIETSDGVVCESVAEEIQDPVPLDDVKYEFRDGNNDREKGLQIMVDVLNVNNLNAYFYWEYAETWEFEVPYMSTLLPDARICYKSVKPPLFLISSTQDLVQKQILNHPLFFIDNTSNRLYIKYSVLVTQHTLSQPTYVYYHDLIEVNEDRGSLFDTSPITLIGNMRNISNPAQPVLGNFQVSGAVSKRLFIHKKEIEDRLNVPGGFDNCQSVFAGIMTGAAILDSLKKAGWIVMDSTYNSAVDDTIISLTNSRGCFDCRVNGSKIKPDYWDGEK